MHQVRVGNIGFAKGNQVGAVLGGLFSHGLVITVVHHPGTLAAGGAVGRFQGCVVKRALGQFTRTARGAFDDVDVG